MTRGRVGFLFGAVAVAGATLATAFGAHALTTAPARPIAGPASLTRYQGLSSPASVVHDAQRDRYLVSNVNGGALDHDGNGFISVLSPDGRVVERRWIAGGKNGVHLDAPKGLALGGGVLYVADISVVRRFDAATGAPRGEVKVPGSTYLHDVTLALDGRLFVSDAGPPLGSWDGTGTQAVHVIEGDRVRTLVASDGLGRPSGIAWTKQGLVVAPFGSNELYRLDEKGTRRDVTKLPAGGLAGVIDRDGWLLVTSWQASSVFVGKLGGPFEVALARQGSPADIGYDRKRGRLLVPHFAEGTVETYVVR